MNNLKENSGVINLGLTNADYVAGTLPYEVVCRDWKPYLPTGEKQSNRYFDTMACVTFSALNTLETQLNYQMANGTLVIGSLLRYPTQLNKVIG